MRLLHYPPQSPTSFESDPDRRQIGIGAHTEYDLFSVTAKNIAYPEFDLSCSYEVRAIIAELMTRF